MSDLIVITFRGEGDARAALEHIRQAERGGGISVSDFAVVEKDAGGNIHHSGEVDKATKGGAAGGGFLGLLIGLAFFPVLGLLAGAAAGALLGKSLHHDVDKNLIRDVTADLTPGTSALFLLVEGSAAAIVGSVREFQGKVYQTSVSDELESQLNEALKSRS
jgi:uncharacterized membrane protein